MLNFEANATPGASARDGPYRLGPVLDGKEQEGQEEERGGRPVRGNEGEIGDQRRSEGEGERAEECRAPPPRLRLQAQTPPR